MPLSPAHSLLQSSMDVRSPNSTMSSPRSSGVSASSQSPSSRYYDIHGPNKRKALQDPVSDGSYTSFAPQAPQAAIEYTFRNGTTDSVPSLFTQQQQFPFQNPSIPPGQSLPNSTSLHQHGMGMIPDTADLDPELSEIMTNLASPVPDVHGDEILEQLLKEASETGSEIMYYDETDSRDHVTMSGDVTVSASNLVHMVEQQNGQGNSAGNQDVLEILSQFS